MCVVRETVLIYTPGYCWNPNILMLGVTTNLEAPLNAALAQLNRNTPLRETRSLV